MTGPAHSRPLTTETGPTVAWLGSVWLHAAFLTMVTLAAWLSLGFREAPISSDQAYLTYMGQAIFRGEPIYATTFVTYTPFGAMASAASMLVGSWVGLPTYLAPRYLAVALGVGSVLLVNIVTRRATGSPLAGLVAGLVLAGFPRLAASSLSTLQPKHLVIFFALLAAAACQRRRWGMSGKRFCFAAELFFAPPTGLSRNRNESGRGGPDRLLKIIHIRNEPDRLN